MNKPEVKCLALIINRKKSNLVKDICHKHQLFFTYACLGLGTASNEILDYLGIGEIENELICTFVPIDKLSMIQEKLADALHIEKPGGGILFTLPINGISSLFMKNILLEEPHNKEAMPMEQGAYALIAGIVNKGYRDQFMDAARSAGAAGGTLLHARSLNSEDSQSFMGMHVQEEKEIILILTTQEKKKDIMTAINQTCGLKTEACGVLFSLPVDSVLGCQFQKNN